MSKAYPTQPKGIRVANSGKMQHGQIIGGTDTMYQRSLNENSSLHPRNGSPKRIAETVAPAAPAMKRQTKPAHEFLHGAPLDDEREPPIKSHEKPIPVHPGMTVNQRAALHPVANDPAKILEDAANLGRRPQKA